MDTIVANYLSDRKRRTAIKKLNKFMKLNEMEPDTFVNRVSRKYETMGLVPMGNGYLAVLKTAIRDIQDDESGGSAVGGLGDEEYDDDDDDDDDDDLSPS